MSRNYEYHSTPVLPYDPHDGFGTPYVHTPVLHVIRLDSFAEHLNNAPSAWNQEKLRSMWGIPDTPGSKVIHNMCESLFWRACEDTEFYVTDSVGERRQILNLWAPTYLPTFQHQHPEYMEHARRYHRQWHGLALSALKGMVLMGRTAHNKRRQSDPEGLEGSTPAPADFSDHQLYPDYLRHGVLSRGDENDMNMDPSASAL